MATGRLGTGTPCALPALLQLLCWRRGDAEAQHSSAAVPEHGECQVVCQAMRIWSLLALKQPRSLLHVLDSSPKAAAMNTPGGRGAINSWVLGAAWAQPGTGTARSTPRAATSPPQRQRRQPPLSSSPAACVQHSPAPVGEQERTAPPDPEGAVAATSRSQLSSTAGTGVELCAPANLPYCLLLSCLEEKAPRQTRAGLG